MSVEIKVKQKPLGCVVMLYQMFHAIDRRPILDTIVLSVVTNEVVSIQVMALSIQPVHSLVNTIRVKHRYYDDLEISSQHFGLLSVAHQKLYDALDSPARWRLARMNTGAQKNDRLIEVSSFLVQVFFRKDDPIVGAANLIVKLSHSVKGSDCDHVHQMQVFSVTEHFLFNIEFLAEIGQISHHVHISLIGVRQRE